jgi:hypothetical protein
LVACEVRRGRIEVLAFAVLTTHFHLVVRSRTGELALVMQRVTNLYVRYFNRTRRRDGPLFRSRYLSKPVRSMRYLFTLIRYVDQNAPNARLVFSSPHYPFGSASLYASVRRPPWLSCEVVERMLGCPAPSDRAAAYERVFGSPLRTGESLLIERRLDHATDADDWDSLIGAAPERVRKWMLRKARLADGTRPGLPYVAAADVDREIQAEMQGSEEWSESPTARCTLDLWAVLRFGLLRDLSGMTFSELGRRCGSTRWQASRQVEHHARLLREGGPYTRTATEVAARCLRPSE